MCLLWLTYLLRYVIFRLRLAVYVIFYYLTDVFCWPTYKHIHGGLHMHQAVYFRYQLLCCCCHTGCSSVGRVGCLLIRRLVGQSPAPPVYLSKCPWARYWTPDCSWWLCHWCMNVWVSDEQVGFPLVCEWVNVDLCCKALWAVEMLEKCYINTVRLPFTISSNYRAASFSRPWDFSIHPHNHKK